MSDWLTVLPGWAAPPVVGTVIGFVTKDVAIRHASPADDVAGRFAEAFAGEAAERVTAFAADFLSSGSTFSAPFSAASSGSSGFLRAPGLR